MTRPFKYEKHIDIMLPTTDNFYGNYDNNTVKLTYIGRLTDGRYRVTVWGNDDFGLIYDANDKGTAKVLFNKLKTKVNITLEELYNLGFINAC